MSSKIVSDLTAEMRAMSAPEVIARAIDFFGFEKIALASSFGIEDQAITHIAWSHNRSARVFTLDTGRLFQETYDVMQETKEKYSMTIEECFPDAGDVASMVEAKGPNLFLFERGEQAIVL